MRLVFASVISGCLLMAAGVFAQAPQTAPQAPAAPQAPQAAPAAPTQAALQIPDLVKSVLPVYPPDAITTKVQGTVELRLTIGADGHVSDARVSSTVPPLDQAALDAVRQWQFNASANGAQNVPVRVRFVLSPFPADTTTASAAAPDASGRIQWIPGDFEFIYRYRCRDGEVHLGTVDDQIVIYHGDQRETMPLTVSLEDKQRIFLTMVARGFFAAPSAETTPGPSAGVRQLADAYEATVVGQLPGSSADDVRLELPEGRRRSNVSVHQLEARQFGTWRGVRWQEPVPKSDQDTQGLATLGEMIREIALPKTSDKKTKDARCE
jgi:protein TonB